MLMVSNKSSKRKDNLSLPKIHKLGEILRVERKTFVGKLQSFTNLQKERLRSRVRLFQKDRNIFLLCYLCILLRLVLVN